MKKITLVLLAVIFVLSCVGLAACNKGAQEALDNYLLEQANQLVDADFVLPATLGEYELDWSSDNAAITVEKREADNDYLAKVNMGDEVTEVTLTVSIGKLSKSFTVRVAALDVHYIAGKFVFPQDRTIVTESFVLPTEFTYGGKTATITWSVDDDYSHLISIGQLDGKTACIVTVSTANPEAKIKATFALNGEEITYTYRMTISAPMSHLEEIDYWYNNTGVSMEIRGYVVAIGEAYSEQYGNMCLYVMDEEFGAGYYVYRVGVDAATAPKVKVGTYVIITGSTNTNYNGLIETDGNGTLTVDESKPAIDVNDYVYAFDNDLIGDLPAAVYHQSRLVSLTNWEVKSVATSAPEAGKSATLFTLTKGGAEVTIAVSKYLAGEYSAAAGDAKWEALCALINTVKAGDVVSVTGILGSYNNNHQIYLRSVDDLTTGGTKDPDGTQYPGAKVAAAMEAVQSALAEAGADKRITSETTFTLPTSSGDVTIDYELCAQLPALTLEGGNTFKVVPPANEEKVNVKATYTVKDGETVVYETVDFFRISTVVLTAEVIRDDIVDPPMRTDVDFELYQNEYVTWSVTAGEEALTIEGNTAKIHRGDEDVRVTLTATVTYNGVTLTRNYFVTVEKDELADYYVIELTVDSMQLQSGTYQDGTVNVDRVPFTYTELGNYGDGIQMRIKDEAVSTIKNDTAFHAGIAQIVVTLSDTKSVYDNADAFKFEFGTADGTYTETKMFSTVADTNYYVITPDSADYTYFKLSKVIESYSFYFKSIEICFTEPNDITYTDEEKVDAELATLKVDKLTYTEDGTATLPVAGTTHTDVTIAWSANNSAVVIDGANMTLTMPVASARIVLTATLTCGEATDTKEFVIFAVVDVMDAIALLQHKDSFEAPYTITGTVKEITEAYSEKYGNVTLVITVGTLDLECYRLSGDAAATVKVGDEIVVTGTEVSKYNDDIELRYAEAAFATVSEKTDAEKVAADKAALTLEESYTENFTLPTTGSNGSTIAWAVTEGTAITLDGASATVVRGDVDATVVLTATITCGTASDTKTFTVTVPQASSVEPPVEDVMTVAEALAAANALGKDEYSAEKVYVEGVIAEITKFDSGRSSYTFYIKDADGTDQLTVFSCKTTADITKIYVGDTVKVYGYLQNYKGNTPEVTYKGDENPVFVTLTRGTSAITVAENDNVTVTLSAQSGENGTEFSFTIVVDTPEYVLASVAVNGTTVTATDGVYRAIIDGPTTVVVSGYVPSTETSIVTVDFKANFGTYGGSWSNSYAEHTITSADLGVDASEATFNVVLSNASKQTGTITDMPCLASKNTAQYVTVSLSSGTIAGVTFNLKEWSDSKKFTTITIEYTTDGSTWQPTNVGFVDGTATTISPNFTTVSAGDLTEGVIGVRLVYVGNSSSKNQQIGLEGLTLTVK